MIAGVKRVIERSVGAPNPNVGSSRRNGAEDGQWHGRCGGFLVVSARVFLFLFAFVAPKFPRPGHEGVAGHCGRGHEIRSYVYVLPGRPLIEGTLQAAGGVDRPAWNHFGTNGSGRATHRRLDFIDASSAIVVAE